MNEQLQALIVELRQTMQLSMGGTPAEVDEVIVKMEALANGDAE